MITFLRRKSQLPISSTPEMTIPVANPKQKVIPIGEVWQTIRHTGSFLVLLFAYLLTKSVDRTTKNRFAKTTSTLLTKVVTRFDAGHAGSISRIEHIGLAMKNMAAKRTRTYVTVGGMAIGIGAIVFLVSIGYGLQQVVISRVAHLDEMKQADVTTQPGSKVRINDKSLADFKNLGQVSMALPLIAVVGRVSYQNSVSDMPVYGVTSDYLKQSAIKPVEGKIFDSNTVATVVPTGTVAGAETSTSNIGSVGDNIQTVDFTISPTYWIRVRSAPTTSASIIGYTKRTEGDSTGKEVWGASYTDNNGNGKAGYDSQGKSLGKWIEAPVLLWKKQVCEVGSGDCENGQYVVSREADGTQTQKTGYFAEINVTVTPATIVNSSHVLGVATDSATAAPTTLQGGGTLPFVEIASEAGIVAPPETKTVSMAADAKLQAVVNVAMLKVLGIPEAAAIGKQFSASFIVTGDLLSDPTQKLASTPAVYTIVGVTPDDKTPLFYVPFLDIRSLGVDNYSQVKVVADNQGVLPKLRKQIEAMGYTTTSVADTVSQINSLFATARAILVLVGMAALAVAALGMFNTLTVSLLERTREVGLMKALGMKSSEVKEMFLTESMIMGFIGGILGIVIGFAGGLFLSIILSVFSLIKGVGFVDISYLPFPFLLVIVLLSLFVGITTGMYPARRATQISALDALRYE